MHRRILRGGYELKNTDLRQALDGGRFNCVTATVLFNYLAGRSGIECRGLQMPGHAMSRLFLPDGPLDVETTCPRWFQVKDDPRRRKPDITLARELLGWSPRIPLKEGLKHTIAYFRQYIER